MKMALPKQTLPIFELEVPSTQKKVKFRPFTVREEKALLQALEVGSESVMLNAAKEVISVCVPDIGNPDNLTFFDVEYIMTALRAKSVEESVTLELPCDTDPSHEKTRVMINLESLKVHRPEGHLKEIPLYDDVGVVMKYPTLKDLTTLENATGPELVRLCIDYVYSADEIFRAEDQTVEELTEFIDSLTKAQFDKIEDLFFKRMPYFEMVAKYKCRQCGTEHVKRFRGFSNFFG
jgi:hypothetical protein